MIEAVVFDLDDTLYPERDYVKSGFHAVAEALKASGYLYAEQRLNVLFGQSREHVFDRFLTENSGVNSDVSVEDLLKIYRNHFPAGLGFFEDVRPLLSALKALGVKTGIITDGRAEAQKAKLQALGCFSVFDKCIMTAELGENRKKPHSQSYRIMAEYLGVSLNKMMYIGDNATKDFAIRAECPVVTVQILRKEGLYLNAPLTPPPPNYQIKSLSEVVALLNNEAKTAEDVSVKS